MNLLPSRQRLPPLFIRVLVTKQGEQWLAQGLDHDLAAQGSSDQLAIRSFIRILRARLRLDYQNGRTPLQGIPQAPEHFFQEWERLERAQEQLVTQPAADPADDTPPAYVIQQIVQGGGTDLNR